MFLVQQLCDCNLKDLLNEKQQLSESEVEVVMTGLLSALSYCHSKGIVHCDIKLDNILLVNRNELRSVKLADFGLASSFTKIKMLSFSKGTPLYMAPEVIHQEYNDKSDVWSAGIVLYYLITGNPLFRGRTKKDLYLQILQSNSNIICSHLDRFSRLRGRLSNMITKDPNLRPSSNILHKEFASDLFLREISKFDKIEIFKYFSRFASQSIQYQAFSFCYAITWDDSQSLILPLIYALLNDGEGNISKLKIAQFFKDIASKEEIDSMLSSIIIFNSGPIEYTHLQAIFCTCRYFDSAYRDSLKTMLLDQSINTLHIQ